MINIALAFDEAYTVHGATTIQSIVANAAPQDRLHFHILDTGLLSCSRERIKSIVAGKADLEFLSVDDSFFDGFPTAHHAASTYARLALPDLLPDLKQVLYLDSDLVVVDSLRELWGTDISEVACGAVPDSMHFFRGSALQYWDSIGLPENATYFSAGVMLLNLEAWRTRGVVESFRQWVSENSQHMGHSDQSALNALLHDQVKLLPLRWNLQTPLIPPVRYGWGCTQEMADAVAKPAIVHYVTNRKPWRSQYRVPMADLYWRYRRQLNWAKQTAVLSNSNRGDRVKEEVVHWARCVRSSVRKLLGRIPKPV